MSYEGGANAPLRSRLRCFEVIIPAKTRNPKYFLATLFTKHYLLITHKNNCGHLIQKGKGRKF